MWLYYDRSNGSITLCRVDPRLVNYSLSLNTIGWIGESTIPEFILERLKQKLPNGGYYYSRFITLPF